MKRYIPVLALVLGLGLFGWAPQAHAQWAVFDGANLANNQIAEIRNYAQYLQQVQTAMQTYQQLVESYQEQVAQYKSLNGIGDYQDLFENPELRQFLPPGWEHTLQQATSCVGLSGIYLGECVTAGMQDATQSLLTDAEAQVHARRQQVQSLINQLGKAQDAKQTADLNVRMTGEVANLLNEMEATRLAAQQEQEDRYKQQFQLMSDMYNQQYNQTKDPLSNLGTVHVTPIVP